MSQAIKVGDLVYIPSEVTLYTGASVMKLSSPANLLITARKGDKYEVYYEGKAWTVNEKDVYKVRNKNDKVC